MDRTLSDQPPSGVKQRSLSASASAPALPRSSAPPRAQTPDTRGSRAGSAISRAPVRPRTAQASHSGTRGLGTKSTFGTQTLGGRASAPSFSFGSAPARIALSGGSQRRAELQPSVAASSQKNPGPIYNPKGNKPMGDGPRHPFGTEVRASRTLALALAFTLTTPHLNSHLVVRLASGPHPTPPSPDATATSDDQRRDLQDHGAVDVAWPRHLRAAERLRATVARGVENKPEMAGQHDPASWLAETGQGSG